MVVNAIKINYRIGGRACDAIITRISSNSHYVAKNSRYSIKNFTVICSDLRGYGDSDKPVSDKKHFAYSKVYGFRSNKLMKKLGFNKYYLIGHDRGGGST